MTPARCCSQGIGGSFGIGAFSITCLGRGRFQFEVRTGTADDLMACLTAGDRAGEAWVLQPRLVNHPDLVPIMSRGLGTIRIVTRSGQGQPRVLFALMKLTVGDNATDNFQHGLTGNLVVAIDLQTGRLSTGRGSRRRDWPVM
jgi:hypothetical protein